MELVERIPAHREIPVKVNAFVDEGIAPLVVALNEFGGVVTVDSCEGRDGMSTSTLSTPKNTRLPNSSFGLHENCRTAEPIIAWKLNGAMAIHGISRGFWCREMPLISSPARSLGLPRRTQTARVSACSRIFPLSNGC